MATYSRILQPESSYWLTISHHFHKQYYDTKTDPICRGNAVSWLDCTTSLVNALRPPVNRPHTLTHYPLRPPVNRPHTHTLTIHSDHLLTDHTHTLTIHSDHLLTDHTRTVKLESGLSRHHISCFTSMERNWKYNMCFIYFIFVYCLYFQTDINEHK